MPFELFPSLPPYMATAYLSSRLPVRRWMIRKTGSGSLKRSHPHFGFQGFLTTSHFTPSLGNNSYEKFWTLTIIKFVLRPLSTLTLLLPAYASTVEIRHTHITNVTAVITKCVICLNTNEDHCGSQINKSINQSKCHFLHLCTQSHWQCV